MVVVFGSFSVTQQYFCLLTLLGNVLLYSKLIFKRESVTNYASSQLSYLICAVLPKGQRNKAKMAKFVKIERLFMTMNVLLLMQLRCVFFVEIPIFPIRNTQ